MSIDIDTLAREIRNKNKSDGNEDGIVTLWASFETGYQGAYRIYFAERVKITGIKGIVIKALAATNSGTVTGANTTGNSTGGVITFAASAALGNEQTAAPTTNMIVEAGSYYSLTTQKTTVGGVVLVTVQYEKVN